MLHVTELHMDASAGPVPRDEKASRARRFFGVAVQAGTFRRLAYLLLGLPLGVAWFAAIVTAVSVSVSLLGVALVGVPLLWATWHGIRLVANVERSAANALVDQNIPLRPIVGESGKVWTQLRSMSRDTERWRELAFAVFKFPLGVITFTLAIGGLTVPCAVALAPITARLGDHHFASGTFASAADRFATSSWSPLFVPVGIVLLVSALHVLNAVADGCGRFATRWLGDPSR